MNITDEILVLIKNLVGDVSIEQLKHVDSFVAEKLAIFMPISGRCFYAAIPKHTHPAYMFIIPFIENTSIELDGEIIQSKVGYLNMLRPNIEHTEIIDVEIPRYLAILIEPQYFHSILSDYDMEIENKNKYISVPVDNHLINKARAFMMEYINKLPGSKRMLNVLTEEITHSIIRLIFDIQYKDKTIENRLEINYALEYMIQNMKNKITVNDIAEHVHLSSSHFMKIFKEEMGISPMQYLNDQRLNLVKKLLMDNEKSITEIALESGYSTSSYMTNIFQKKYKITPSQYRKQMNVS